MHDDPADGLGRDLFGRRLIGAEAGVEGRKGRGEQRGGDRQCDENLDQIEAATSRSRWCAMQIHDEIPSR